VPDQTFSEQWTAKALDTVDTVVATVNDRAVRPVVVAARGVVFGVIIGVIGLLLVVLFCVGLFRLIVVYSPGHHVWAAYLVLGALFCIAGAFLYSRRGTAPSAND
jgi:uncharacterized protein YacL